MEKLLKVIGLIIFSVVLGTITGLYSTFITLEIASYYNIEAIMNLGFRVIFGLMLIKGVIFYSHKDEDEMSINESISTIIFIFIEYMLLASICWFSAWILSFIIT